MGNVVVEERTIILNVLHHIICNVCLCVLCNHMRSFWHSIVNCDITLINPGADDTDVVPKELSRWISMTWPWFWFSAVSCLVVVWVQKAEATSPLLGDWPYVSIEGQTVSISSYGR